jgi:hypothetical protein
MPLTQDFEDLYGVTEEHVLNFWASNLREAIGSKLWSQICNSTGVYLASVLGHLCLQSVDRMEILSPDYSPSDLEFRRFVDLTQIAELMIRQLTSAKNPLWMESAGAHILLYAGFFQSQNKARHNIEFYSTVGRECYLMAAVGKRERMMKLMAADFNRYLFHLANPHRYLRENRYLIRNENLVKRRVNGYPPVFGKSHRRYPRTIDIGTARHRLVGCNRSSSSQVSSSSVRKS